MNAQEFVIYPSDKSSVRTDIEENVGDYFTQNTPLLDTYSGAAAAYSLRKLSSSYSGSAVEVYNGSSYADIGFDVFGGLNTVALAAHCGSNSGYVSKWYCQSGNSNDAVQTNTARMPKIYDGTTGVVTENGKPAVEFDGTDDGLNSATNLRTVGGASSIFATYKIPTTSVLQNPIAFHKVQRWLSNRSNATYQELAISTANTADEYIKYLSLSTANQRVYTSIWDGTTQRSSVDDVVLHADGVIQSPTAVSAGFGVLPSGTNSLGFRNDITSQFCTGTMQEVVIYLSDQDAAGNRTDIESNINTFYNIYS